MKRVLQIVVFSLLCILVVGCSKEEPFVVQGQGLEGFIVQYNESVNTWLKQEIEDVDKRLEDAKGKLDEAETEKARESLLASIDSLEKMRIPHQRRLDHGEYFSMKSEGDIPLDLVWEDGMNNPEIGDPRAKKGGRLNLYISDFPPTFRPFGTSANSNFSSKMYDDVSLGLVGLHPLTQNVIPGVAKYWAYGKDGRTVFYKIDPDARYSNGEKVRAGDYMMGGFVKLSDNVNTPFMKQAYRSLIANVTTYGDEVLSVSIPEKKPFLVAHAQFSPVPPKYYSEYGPDFETRFQWRVEPTTGPYTVYPGGVKKGKSITLSRVKNWWAKDKKFYKNAYNVDYMHYRVVRDRSKAFELFRAGALDVFSLGNPSFWYEKMEIPEYFNGYIAKAQFYNVYPRIPRGLYINTHNPKMRDINMRLGLAHALNFSKVDTIFFRGDAERLQQFSVGYGEYTNPAIEAYPFSITKAREYFAKAGYTSSNDEGYLVNDKGEVLEIEITASNAPLLNQKMVLFGKEWALVSEEAKKAGLKLSLDLQQPTVAYRKLAEKRHEVGYLGWSVNTLYPSYYGLFHSSYAFDENGNPMLNTNNMSMYVSDRLDELCKQVREATTTEEVRVAAWEVQQMIHDNVLFIPALSAFYNRIGYWSWVQWPNTAQYEFSSPRAYVPMESYLFWIDEEEKEGVIKSKREGRALPEQNHLYDLYRDGIPLLEELNIRKVMN